MKNIKEKFINLVIKEMEKGTHSNGRVFTQKEITEILVVLEQRLEDFEEFLKDIKTNEENLYIWTDKDEDDDYELIRIHIGFSKMYSYDIIIKEDFRMIGYCMCDETDEGYNKIHKCCGVKCDWYKPTFFIKKTEYIAHRIDFKGLEKDLWKAEDEFIEKYFEKDESIEIKKNEKRNQLLQDIAYHKQFIQNLQEQLENLE